MGFQSVLASDPKSTFNTKTTVYINKNISHLLCSMVKIQEEEELLIPAKQPKSRGEKLQQRRNKVLQWPSQNNQIMFILNKHYVFSGLKILQFISPFKYSSWCHFTRGVFTLCNH